MGRRTIVGRLAGKSAPIAAALALALAGACSPQAGTTTATEATSTQTATTHPESGLEIIPVTISQAGESWVFQSELAATPAEQARGLMFRTDLGPNEGMLFPNDPPQVRSFWMKNTVIPLDMIFIGIDSRILNIHANTTPYSEQSYPSEGLAIGVLEIPGGRAAELGLEPGARVEW